jgi:hypothetical protein
MFVDGETVAPLKVAVSKSTGQQMISNLYESWSFFHRQRRIGSEITYELFG